MIIYCRLFTLAIPLEPAPHTATLQVTKLITTKFELSVARKDVNQLVLDQQQTSDYMLRQIVRVSKFWHEYCGKKPVDKIDNALLRDYVDWRRDYYHRMPVEQRPKNPCKCHSKSKISSREETQLDFSPPHPTINNQLSQIRF